MARLGLDHVQVAAPPDCETAARAFYGVLLGLPEVEKPAGVRDSGGVWFALAGDRQLHIGVAADFAPARKAHPALRVDPPSALEDLAGRLLDAGAPLEWDRRIAGVRRFFTADPWGNRLELLARAD
jgi:catechol 2,3-dioxygenase-like lactoylglutathione lyase family enzyme